MQVCSTVVSVLRHPGACTPREKGLERETILCGHLKGHAAAVTAALVKVDVGEPLRSMRAPALFLMLVYTQRMLLKYALTVEKHAQSLLCTMKFQRSRAATPA